jgi:uncharacterized protein YeeX (DUF496 family)
VPHSRLSGYLRKGLLDAGIPLLSTTTVHCTHIIHLYNMEDDREQRVDEAMIVEGNGDRERRESWKHLDTEGGPGGGGGWMDAWRMMGS